MLSVVDVVVVVALILRPPFEACTTAYYRTRTHARTHESTLVVYEGFHSSCKYTADRRRIIHLHTGNFYAIVRNSHTHTRTLRYTFGRRMRTENASPFAAGSASTGPIVVIIMRVRESRPCATSEIIAIGYLKWCSGA